MTDYSFVLGLVIIEMSHYSCRSENSTEAKVLPHFPSYFVPHCHVSWILTSMWCCQGRRIKETIVDPDHEPQSSDSRCLSSVSRTRIIIERKHREHNSQFNIFYTYIVSQVLILMFWFWFIINIHKHNILVEIKILNIVNLPTCTSNLQFWDGNLLPICICTATATVQYFAKFNALRWCLNPPH